MNKKLLLSSSAICWGSLGFYRGTQEYNYNYKKECIEYNEKKNNKYYIGSKPLYLYSSAFGYGAIGIIYYINPIIIFLIIPKELYRLEVDIRNLEEEKVKYSYYKLF